MTFFRADDMAARGASDGTINHDRRSSLKAGGGGGGEGYVA